MVLNNKIQRSNNHQIQKYQSKSDQDLLEKRSGMRGRRWNDCGPLEMINIPTSCSLHQQKVIRKSKFNNKKEKLLNNCDKNIVNYHRECPLRISSSGIINNESNNPGLLINNSNNKKVNNSNWERRKEDKCVKNTTTKLSLSSSSTSSITSPSKELKRDYLSKGINNDHGILKKSFLIHKSEENVSNGKYKNSPLKSYQSVQSLIASGKSSYPRLNQPAVSSTVKKSVSFSSETSFVEKRKSAIAKKTVHEAKVYQKGVLRDINESVIKSIRKPPSGKNMTQLLLRAAKDADELALNDIINRLQRSNLDEIDINATDSSGRSAISYIAGNGAGDLLEIILLFPYANSNLSDNEGNTPLHFAAQAGQVNCLNILLEKSPKIEIDARNVLGFTPLMKAALQGRVQCAKTLLFAGANPALRDYGRGLKAEQWARFCGRHICANAIERFTKNKLMEKSSCRWGSESELASRVLQGKQIMPIPLAPIAVQSSGLKSRIKRAFKTNHSDKSFSLVSQLTNAALCASSPALPKTEKNTSKSLNRPLNVPQLKITLATTNDIIDTNKVEKMIENNIIKPVRNKKKMK